MLNNGLLGETVKWRGREDLVDGASQNHKCDLMNFVWQSRDGEFV
jgi:hypothetical protein